MAPAADPVAELAQLAQRIQAAHERRARELGISPTLARLLHELRNRTPMINELAGLLGLDKSSTSGLVDRAQRRGYVRRVPSQIDRRSVRVRLTDAGRALTEVVAAQFSEDVHALLEPLPAGDREQLTRLLSDVVVAHAQRHGVDLFATPA